MGMTWPDFLTWMVNAGVPALILVAVQAIMARLGLNQAVATPRVAALLLAVGLGVLVEIVQFELKIVLFKDVRTIDDLIRMTVTWLAAAQAIYNLAWKPARRVMW